VQLLQVLLGDLDVLSLPYFASIFVLVPPRLPVPSALLISDTVARFAIDLMEVTFAFARRGEELN
jgi:hypothetical protein